jgi:hypothetical protein
MKTAFALIGQFLLFLLLDAVGGIFYHPFGVQTALAQVNGEARGFAWDGIIFMLLAYVLLLVNAALRKRLPRSAPWTTVALVLAALAGYLMRFGFITHW